MTELSFKEKFVGLGPTTFFRPGECSILYTRKGSGLKIIGTGCTTKAISAVEAFAELFRLTDGVAAELKKWLAYRNPTYYNVYLEGKRTVGNIYIEAGSIRLLVVTNLEALETIAKLEREHAQQ